MNFPATNETAVLELSEREKAWARVVIEKVRALRYGTVQIKIHDAQVAVIEATEQTRFELGPKQRR
jgi:hypothetical protein